MLYAILCYNAEDVVCAWSKAENDAVMERLAAVQAPLAAAGRLGPVARLVPTTAATSLRKGRDGPVILDGPFVETKEQLLGFYVVDCDTLDDAIAVAQELMAANAGPGGYEIRPVSVFRPGAAQPGGAAP